MRTKLCCLLVVSLPVVSGCTGEDRGGGSDPSIESSASASEVETSPRDAASLLERTIAFHDPRGLWPSASFEISLAETRPDGSVRNTELVVDNGKGRYRLETEADDERVSVELEGDTVTAITGSWAEERALRMRNYYLFLYGLPMKFRDPGTRLDPKVTHTEFDGREVLALRLTYDPQVGEDIWYAYLDPETSEMVGYRFFHDEEVGDGEYILLEGLAEVGGLRLPASRTWYTNKEDELLGTDEIVVVPQE